jgi:predicted small metal-binding protein
MTNKVTGSELGIEDCDFTARGETVSDVVGQVVEHLRTEHGINMPDVDTIMTGDLSKSIMSASDPAVHMIVDRLKETLNIVPPNSPTEARPAIGRTLTA